METLTLTTWGRSRAPLEALIREAASCYTAAQQSRTIVHSVDQDGYWMQARGGLVAAGARTATGRRQGGPWLLQGSQDSCYRTHEAAAGGGATESCCPQLAVSIPGGMPITRCLPCWLQVGSRPIRPLSTVVLPGGQVSRGGGGGAKGGRALWEGMQRMHRTARLSRQGVLGSPAAPYHQ
jgi:hypothetical protein